MDISQVSSFVAAHPLASVAATSVGGALMGVVGGVKFLVGKGDDLVKKVARAELAKMRAEGLSDAFCKKALLVQAEAADHVAADFRAVAGEIPDPIPPAPPAPPVAG